MNRKFALLSGVALACMITAPAFAQSKPAAAAEPGDMTIIVTAQRRAEKLNEVPVSIIANNAEQLKTAGVVDTRDLALVTPGLSFTTMGAWSNPAIRGVSSTITGAGGEGPNAIYVDGIYMPSQQGAFADLPDVDHVEVSKGPQGTLFGRNATGGAIQIFTKGPSFTPHVDLSVSDSVYLPGNGAHDANSLLTSLFVSGPIIGDKLAGSFSASYRNSGGYSINDADGSSFGAVKSYIYRGKLLWQPTDDIKVSLAGFYTRRYDENVENGAVINGYSLIQDLPGAIVASQPYHVSFDQTTPHMMYKQYGGSLKAEWRNPWGTLTSMTAYQHVTNDIHVNVYGGANAPIACLQALACIDYEVKEPSESMSQEFVFASRKFGPASFIAGVFMYHENAGNVDILNNTPRFPEFGGFPAQGGFLYVDQKVGTSSVAGFAEGSYDFTEKLHVSVGVRYTVDSKWSEGGLYGGPMVKNDPFKKTWWATTPRFTIRYDWTNHFNTYFNISKGFKSGVFGSQSFVGQPIDPEKLTSFEGGAKLSYRTFNFNIAAYYYDYQDLQLTVFNGQSTVSVNANAQIFGLDFDGQWKINDHWEIRAGGSIVPTAEYSHYDHAPDFLPPVSHWGDEGGGGGLQSVFVNGNGKRLLKAPEFTGFASVMYHTDLSPGRLDASVSIYDSTEYYWNASNTIKTGGYFTLAGDVSFKPNFLPNTKITLFGRNLTGETYVSGTLISAEAEIGFFNPPREIGMRVEYSF